MGIFSNKKEMDDELFMKILFDTYKDKVYRIAYCILKDEQDAKDIVQDTFITVYNKFDQLRDQNKIQNWICVIASNLAKTKYRKGKREILAEDDQKITAIADASMDLNIPEELLVKRELRAYLMEQINGLKSHYKEIIILYYYAGLSYDEISHILDVNLGTVKSRLFRAKLILKQKIEADTKHETMLNRNGGDNGNAKLVR